MKVLIIGATGTIGKKVNAALAGRSGDIKVDIASANSIKSLFQRVDGIDACAVVGGSGTLDNFQTLTEEHFQPSLQAS